MKAEGKLYKFSMPLNLLAFCALLPAAAEGSFVAAPMEHHLRAAAGGRETAVITISNTGQRPLMLKLYFSDSRFSTDWREEDQKPGTLERSCAPWIDLNESLLEIKPREIRRVALQMTVPDSARGSYWTKLYIEEISNPETLSRRIEGRSYQVFMKQRLGVRIFEDVPGTEHPDALVTAVGVTGAKAGERSVAVRVENAGNSVLHCQGRVELRNSSGEIAQTLPLGSDGEFMMFPQTERNLIVASGASLPPGTYTALVVVDFGGDHLVAGEEIFRIDGEGILTEQNERDAR